VCIAILFLSRKLVDRGTMACTVDGLRKYLRARTHAISKRGALVAPNTLGLSSYNDTWKKLARVDEKGQVCAPTWLQVLSCGIDG